MGAMLESSKRQTTKRVFCFCIFWEEEEGVKFSNKGFFFFAFFVIPIGTLFSKPIVNLSLLILFFFFKKSV